MATPAGPYRLWPTTLVADSHRDELEDPVVVEEPLEILLATGVHELEPEPLAVTLRTPGHDAELVAGLLYGEGIVGGPRDLAELVGPGDTEVSANQVVARLAPGVEYNLEAARRTFSATAACGLCGKTSIAGVFARGFPDLPAGPTVEPELLEQLPTRMRAAQRVFSKTGGLHAAALFDSQGVLRALREDVGRHNAVDKVVGWLLLAGDLPVGESVLVVSGRAGFELVQKALRAGIPVLAAVGAPTTLSLQLAEKSGMTLVGFLRKGRFNVYTGADRVV